MFEFKDTGNFTISAQGGGGGTSGGLVDDAVSIASLSLQISAMLVDTAPGISEMSFMVDAEASFHEPTLYTGSISAGLLIEHSLDVILADQPGSGYSFTLRSTGDLTSIGLLNISNNGYFPSGSTVPAGAYFVTDIPCCIGATHVDTPSVLQGSILATFTTPPAAQEFLGAMANTPDNHGHIRVPDAPALRPQRFTIEATIQPSGPAISTPGTIAMIVGKGPEDWSGGPRGLSYAWLRLDDGRLAFELLPAIGQPGVVVVANSRAPEEETTHIAATFDGSRVRLYVNGILDVEAPTTFTSITYDAGSLRIGGLQHCCGYLGRFEGRIDSVRIWDHARSPEDIHADTTCPPMGSTPGLLGHWDLNGDTLDYSGNGNHGLPTGWIGGATQFATSLLENETFIVLEAPQSSFGNRCRSARLRARATGTAPFFYEWEEMSAGEWRRVAYLPDLTVDNVTRERVYRCRISNRCGSFTSEAVTVRPCSADFNNDDVVNSVDFFDYLAAFFGGGSRCTDVNSNGTTDSQDFFLFLSAFFDGC